MQTHRRGLTRHLDDHTLWRLGWFAVVKFSESVAKTPKRILEGGPWHVVVEFLGSRQFGEFIVQSFLLSVWKEYGRAMRHGKYMKRSVFYIHFFEINTPVDQAPSPLTIPCHSPHSHSFYILHSRSYLFYIYRKVNLATVIFSV